MEDRVIPDVMNNVFYTQDPILKVSDQYLKFWLTFKGSLIKWLAYEMRGDERELR